MRWLLRLFRRPVARPIPPAFAFPGGTGTRPVDPTDALAGLGWEGLVDLRDLTERLCRRPADRDGAKLWCSDLDELVRLIDGALGPAAADLGTTAKLRAFAALVRAADRPAAFARIRDDLLAQLTRG